MTSWKRLSFDRCELLIEHKSRCFDGVCRMRWIENFDRPSGGQKSPGEWTNQCSRPLSQVLADDLQVSQVSNQVGELVQENKRQKQPTWEESPPHNGWDDQLIKTFILSGTSWISSSSSYASFYFEYIVYTQFLFQTVTGSSTIL